MGSPRRGEQEGADIDAWPRAEVNLSPRLGVEPELELWFGPQADADI